MNKPIWLYRRLPFRSPQAFPRPWRQPERCHGKLGHIFLSAPSKSCYRTAFPENHPNLKGQERG